MQIELIIWVDPTIFFRPECNQSSATKPTQHYKLVASCANFGGFLVPLLAMYLSTIALAETAKNPPSKIRA